MSASACSSGSGEPPARGKLSEVDVNVSGWNEARVGATLIDRNGRRTGWNVDRPIDEISGCMYESGSEEGIPDETVPDTLERTTAADTVPGGPQSMPIYHFFRILNDVVTPVGLIDQGGCELRLDPVVGGKVRLAVVATGIGLSGCSDTTSVWVKPGVPSRWRLSWKPAGDKCAVRISRMAAKRPESPPK
jgi:hypothetical protein